MINRKSNESCEYYRDRHVGRELAAVDTSSHRTTRYSRSGRVPLHARAFRISDRYQLAHVALRSGGVCGIRILPRLRHGDDFLRLIFRLLFRNTHALIDRDVMI